MPASRSSSKFFWLVHKDTGEITIACQYGVDTSCYYLIDSVDSESTTWVATHFHIFPLTIPEELLHYVHPAPKITSEKPNG
jgi:hypothetical protein